MADIDMDPVRVDGAGSAAETIGGQVRSYGAEPMSATNLTIEAHPAFDSGTALSNCLGQWSSQLVSLGDQIYSLGISLQQSAARTTATDNAAAEGFSVIHRGLS